jgi:hypothetical protein
VLAQTEWEVVNTLHIGGEGGWDYLTVDPQTHLLYVPRTTHTMVIDPQSGRTVADIPLPPFSTPNVFSWWRGLRGNASLCPCFTPTLCSIN